MCVYRCRNRITLIICASDGGLFALQSWPVNPDYSACSRPSYHRLMSSQVIRVSCCQSRVLIIVVAFSLIHPRFLLYTIGHLVVRSPFSIHASFQFKKWFSMSIFCPCHCSTLHQGCSRHHISPWPCHRVTIQSVITVITTSWHHCLRDQALPILVSTILREISHYSAEKAHFYGLLLVEIPYQHNLLRHYAKRDWV